MLINSCPRCRGQDVDCDLCDGSGMVGEARPAVSDNPMTPEEIEDTIIEIIAEDETGVRRLNALFKSERLAIARQARMEGIDAVLSFGSTCSDLRASCRMCHGSGQITDEDALRIAGEQDGNEASDER